MRKISLCAVAVILLACSALATGGIRPTEQVPPTATSTPTEMPLPTKTGTPTETAVPTEEPTAAVDGGFTIVRVFPSDGELNDQLAEEAAKAKILGREAYVEFDATWCPCCQAIETSLDEGNALMVDAFQGVYIVRADIDAWADDMEGTGFEFDGIPIFFRVDDQGRSTGEWIDGNAWGENIPENMAPPLKEFFRTH